MRCSPAGERFTSSSATSHDVVAPGSPAVAGESGESEAATRARDADDCMLGYIAQELGRHGAREFLCVSATISARLQLAKRQPSSARCLGLTASDACANFPLGGGLCERVVSADFLYTIFETTDGAMRVAPATFAGGARTMPLRRFEEKAAAAIDARCVRMREVEPPVEAT